MQQEFGASRPSHYARHIGRGGLSCDHGATADHLGFRSTAFLDMLRRARRLAGDRTAPILIEGETGTGKTTIARMIHDNSPRASAPFRAVILSTLDDALASSELFGHMEGAFTGARHSRKGLFATGHGGTIVLDEIGKTSMPVQQKLLHVVEYGEFRAVGSDLDLRVDVRIVAATNVPLEKLVADGLFLPDLYARLQLFRLRLPALRERRADIPTLVEHYVVKHAPACGYDVPPTIDPELMAALQRTDWPHNLRQLDGTIHRLLIDAEGARTITLAHCIDDLAYLQGSAPRPPLTDDRVASALGSAGSVAGAARLLGVDRTTVHRFLRRQSNAPHAEPTALRD
jgi:DNA-binding NtrC family response regulator